VAVAALQAEGRKATAAPVTSAASSIGLRALFTASGVATMFLSSCGGIAISVNKLQTCYLDIIKTLFRAMRPDHLQ